jgi:ABC-type polysaccharide/polyol phosphate transport system ATPase subunit
MMMQKTAWDAADDPHRTGTEPDVRHNISHQQPVERPVQQSRDTAIELVSVSKYPSAVQQIDKRFVRNEALQILIELAILTRNVRDRKKGKLGERQLVPLLKDINLTIERGSVVGVVDIGGRSRNALMQILANCDVPSAGAVRFFGKMAAFQQLAATRLDYLTCRENLEFDAQLMGWPRREMLAALKRVPEFSGLEKQLDLPIRRVPRGMLVDLQLSLICCLDYDIVVVDEIGRPQSPKVTSSWQDYLRQAPERDKTIIVTSRQVRKLQECCTHLLLLENAGLLDYGSVAEISEQHAEFLASAEKAPIDETSKTDVLYDDDEDGDLM